MERSLDMYSINSGYVLGKRGTERVKGRRTNNLLQVSCFRAASLSRNIVTVRR